MYTTSLPQLVAHEPEHIRCWSATNNGGGKVAAASREQKIGQLLETISILGMLRKTDEGLYVR